MPRAQLDVPCGSLPTQTSLWFLFFYIGVICSGEGCFSNQLCFSCSHTALSIFLYAFSFCVWMSKCCLLPLLHLHLLVPCCILCAGILPFMQLIFCLMVWVLLFWVGFFFFLPSPDVYKHVSQDLLGYLEVESGRVARGRKIGICQLSLMGKKSHHFADPFLWIAIAAWFPSSVTFR